MLTQKVKDIKIKTLLKRCFNMFCYRIIPRKVKNLILTLELW